VFVCTLFFGVILLIRRGAQVPGSPSVFNTVLYGARNVRRARFRRFYALASISTPQPYTPIFDLVSAV
jgi:hypothetical protein